jgi:predicted small lipoprotein YifL
MSRKSPQIAIVAAAVALSGALAGCGKLGPLERPGPLFGHPNKAIEQRRQQQDPNRPVQTIDPRDDFANPAPPRTVPIEGTGPDPTASGPQGALPDPYANPPR